MIISPKKEEFFLEFKLNFETTNNVSKYEELIFGLEAAKRMGITRIPVYRDSEVIVQQIKILYQTKHPRMKEYRNQVRDLIDNFFHEFKHHCYS